MTINNLPLNKVEWKTLGEVAEIIRGVTYNKNLEVSDNGYKILRANNITVEFSKLNFNDVKQISKNAKVKETQKLYKNDILISVASGSREHVGKVAFIEEAIDYYFGGFMAVIRVGEIILSKYLFHILRSFYFSQFVETTFASATINNLSNSVLKEFKIPIPPLKIQQEIVAILDKFTELTAELTARKKQYAFYREQLLIENGELKMENENNSQFSTINSQLKEVEWKTLGEVASYSKERINFSSVNEDNYVGIENLLQDRAGKSKSNYVPTSGNLTCFNIGDILIGNIRPYLKKIWFADCKGGTNGDVLVIHLIDKGFNARYLYQILADDSFFSYNMQHAKGAKMPRGNKEKIMEFKIPIPPLSEQERIVGILDKFDALTNSISEGLPREIELRQKQYEYYRDKLLTFV